MDNECKTDEINQLIDETKFNETKFNETEFDETKFDKILNEQKKNKFILENKQKIIMGNYKETHILNKELILNNIYSTDDQIYSQIYYQIDNPYQKRLNTILLLLKSELVIPMLNITDIIRFFNWLSPLNNEFNLSSKNWAWKKIKYGNKEKLLLQNSISKQDMGRTFYSNYIDLVKSKLSICHINFCYFEFKSKRFNKVKDIIWSFDVQ